MKNDDLTKDKTQVWKEAVSIYKLIENILITLVDDIYNNLLVAKISNFLRSEEPDACI